MLTPVVFYCKTHTYLILLNRQRIESKAAQFIAQQNPRTSRPPLSSFLPVNTPLSSCSSPPGSPNASLRGRALVLSSSQDLLTAFLFFHFRAPAAQITWTMGQQAFNSCMILLLDAMETGELSRIDKVEKAYVVFQQLEKNGVHGLASMAVERVSWGLAELRRMTYAPDTHVRGVPTMFSRGGNPRRDAEMQGTAGNEARPGSGVMYDTVMGNTGMLLLEDPGLQSFVPEAFAPFTWSMGPGFLEDGGAVHKFKEEEAKKQAEGARLGNAKPWLHHEQVRDTRSSERRRDTPGSPGSAPARSATFSTEPSQDVQPQGLTAPTSSSPNTAELQEQHRQHQSLGGTPTGSHEVPPPHSRHHSFPSLHQPPPPPPNPLTAKATTRDEHRGPSHTAGSSSEWEEYSSLQALMPQFASPRTAPAALSQHATGLAPGQLMTFNNPNVHPSWAARPAAPSSSSFPEPPSMVSHMPSRSQAIPAFTQQSAPMNTWHHAFSYHPPTSSEVPGPACAGTQAEHYATDGWR